MSKLDYTYYYYEKPKELILRKNKKLVFANADRKLSNTEAMLFNYALLRIQFEEDNIYSEFGWVEINHIFGLKPSKSELLKYTERMSDVAFSEIDHSHSDRLAGEIKNTAPIKPLLSSSYKDGVFHFHWGTTDEVKALLNQTENETVDIDLMVMNKLGESGKILFETITTFIQEGLKKAPMTYQEVVRLFKLTGNSNAYKYLKSRFLNKALGEINEQSNFTVSYTKRGIGERSIMEFSWKFPRKYKKARNK